jgi:hypothetical protein
MIYEQIEVVSYCGYRPNERPLSFVYQDKKWEVKDILERWHEASQKAGAPTYSFFKVVTLSGDHFILRYNTRYKTWAIKIT